MNKNNLFKKSHREDNINPVSDSSSCNIDCPNIKRKNNVKTFTFKTISIIFVMCFVVLAGILIIKYSILFNDKKNDPIESVIVNEYNSSDEPVLEDQFFYKITFEKNKYNYDEEIEITFELALSGWGRNYNPGDLSVRIDENEYFEIVGPQEYTFEDAIKQDGTSEYITKKDNDYPLKLKYKIKPKCDSFGVSAINFSIKVNLRYGEWLSFDVNKYGCPGQYWWLIYDDEYIIHINAAYFFNINEEMDLSLDRYKLFEKHSNELYETGNINEEQYIDQFINTLTLGNVLIRLTTTNNRKYVEYYSENLSFRIYLNDDNEITSDIKKLYSENKEKDIAVYLINYMNKLVGLNTDIYTKEIEYISANNVYFHKIYYIRFNSFPFSNYQAYLFDYEYSIN